MFGLLASFLDLRLFAKIQHRALIMFPPKGTVKTQHKSDTDTLSQFVHSSR